MESEVIRTTLEFDCYSIIKYNVFPLYGHNIPYGHTYSLHLKVKPHCLHIMRYYPLCIYVFLKHGLWFIENTKISQQVENFVERKEEFFNKFKST